MNVENSEPEKNPEAVALGKRGGKKGGLARAASLSPDRRVTIARGAAVARWGKKMESMNVDALNSEHALKLEKYLEVLGNKKNELLRCLHPILNEITLTARALAKFTTRSQRSIRSGPSLESRMVSFIEKFELIDYHVLTIELYGEDSLVSRHRARSIIGKLSHQGRIQRIGHLRWKVIASECNPGTPSKDAERDEQSESDNGNHA